MKKSVFVFLVLIFTGQLLSAQDLLYSIKHYNLKGKLAIQGYDVVAYHTEDKAKKGKEDFTFNRNGIEYRFSSQNNLDLFKTNPEQYEPEYGGYCAYAMADGDKVKIDPETFKVVDGKLYLFYNFRFTNTLKYWNKEENILLPKANQEWSKIIEKN